MRAASWKGTSELVAPHDLSSKFLLRMRREDRSPALAFLDQQTILRSMFRAILSLPDTAISVSSDRFNVGGSFNRARHQATSATTRDRTAGQHTSDTKLIDCERVCASHSRRRLHLRRTNEERHTLLPTGPWSSTLLATQGTARHAASR